MTRRRKEVKGSEGGKHEVKLFIIVIVVFVAVLNSAVSLPQRNAYTVVEYGLVGCLFFSYQYNRTLVMFLHFEEKMGMRYQ